MEQSINVGLFPVDNETTTTPIPETLTDSQPSYIPCRPIPTKKVVRKHLELLLSKDDRQHEKNMVDAIDDLGLVECLCPWVTPAVGDTYPYSYRNLQERLGCALLKINANIHVSLSPKQNAESGLEECPEWVANVRESATRYLVYHYLRDALVASVRAKEDSFRKISAILPLLSGTSTTIKSRLEWILNGSMSNCSQARPARTFEHLLLLMSSGELPLQSVDPTVIPEEFGNDLSRVKKLAQAVCRRHAEEMLYATYQPSIQNHFNECLRSLHQQLLTTKKKVVLPRSVCLHLLGCNNDIARAMHETSASISPGNSRLLRSCFFRVVVTAKMALDPTNNPLPVVDDWVIRQRAWVLCSVWHKRLLFGCPQKGRACSPTIKDVCSAAELITMNRVPKAISQQLQRFRSSTISFLLPYSRRAYLLGVGDETADVDRLGRYTAEDYYRSIDGSYRELLQQHLLDGDGFLRVLRDIASGVGDGILLDSLTLEDSASYTPLVLEQMTLRSASVTKTPGVVIVVDHFLPTLVVEHILDCLDQKATMIPIGVVGGSATNTDRAYAFSSISDDDLFMLGKSSNGINKLLLIPSRRHLPFEEFLCGVVSYLMRLLGGLLSPIEGRHPINPDQFIQIQEVLGCPTDSSYALHNDLGDLIYFQESLGMDESHPLKDLHKHLPRDYEVQVVTIVLGTGSCACEVAWYDDITDKVVARATTGINTVHMQLFNTNVGFKHKVTVKSSGGHGSVRYVLSFRWSLSCASEGGAELLQNRLHSLDPSLLQRYASVREQRETMYCISGNLLHKTRQGSLNSSMARGGGTQHENISVNQVSTDGTGTQTAISASLCKQYMALQLPYLHQQRPFPCFRSEQFFNEFPSTVFYIEDKGLPSWCRVADRFGLQRMQQLGRSVVIRSMKAKSKKSQNPGSAVESPRDVCFGVHPPIGPDGSPLTPGDTVREGTVRSYFAIKNAAEHSHVHEASFDPHFAAMVLTYAPKNDPRFLRKKGAYLTGAGRADGDRRPLIIYGHGGSATNVGTHTPNLANDSADGASSLFPRPQDNSVNSILDAVCSRGGVFCLFNNIAKIDQDFGVVDDPLVRYEGLYSLSEWATVQPECDPFNADEFKKGVWEDYEREDETGVLCDLTYGDALSFRECSHKRGKLVPFEPVDGANFLEPLVVAGPNIEHTDSEDGAICHLPQVRVGISQQEFYEHRRSNTYNTKHLYDTIIRLALPDADTQDDVDETMLPSNDKRGPSRASLDHVISAAIRIAGACSLRSIGRGLVTPDSSTSPHATQLLPESESELPAIRQLGYILRSQPTPNVNRSFDIATILSMKNANAIFAEFVRLDSANNGKLWDPVYDESMNTYRVKPTLHHGFKGKDTVFFEMVGHMIFGNLINRMTGKHTMFEMFRDFESDTIPTAERTCLPRANILDAQRFLKFMRVTMGRLGKTNNISFWLSGQHNKSVPDELKKYDNLSHFVLAMCAVMPQTVRDMHGASHNNPTKPDRAAALSLLIERVTACLNFTPKDPGQIPFICALALADLECSFEEPFGYCDRVEALHCGTGCLRGETILDIDMSGWDLNKKQDVVGKRNYIFAKVLFRLLECNEMELYALGMEKSVWGEMSEGLELRCIFTKRRIGFHDVEHILCKLSHTVLKAHPANLCGEPYPCKSYTTPSPIPDFLPGVLKQAFRTIASAYLTVMTPSPCNDLSKREHLEFPECLKHRRDVFRQVPQPAASRVERRPPTVSPPTTPKRCPRRCQGSSRANKKQKQQCNVLHDWLEKHRDVVFDVRSVQRVALFPMSTSALQEIARLWASYSQAGLHNVSKTQQRLKTQPPPSQHCQFRWLASNSGHTHNTRHQSQRKGLLEANASIQASLQEAVDIMACKRHMIADFAGSILLSKEAVKQPPHLDFDWEEIGEDPSRTCRVYAAIFPLSSTGCRLEIFPDVKITNQSTSIHGVPVNIPYGYGILMRGDVVHAGGFCIDHSTGDLRGHGYISTPDVTMDFQQLKTNWKDRNDVFFGNYYVNCDR